ncbi:flavin reductase family protein [Nocardia speluncae]|uniref:Flavin reductase family protein n=1 Tax=Nocardia speluncae TaxID=419477 RepID=A0A846XFW5_9NOCA|nr:flavin reductase family protein [Nocardia speluncae]NKY34998.1 flavin reductase family protein [Nocardia speluncae]
MSAMISIDHLGAAERFSMVSWTVVPRPIAWITSVSPAQENNLAPFSFFTIASTDPLILMVAIEPREDGSPKDTLNNILATREFVVQIAETDRVDEVARSGADSPPHFDELAALALPTSKASRVLPPVIDGCAAVFECELVETRSFGRETLVFGEVLTARVSERLITESGRIDKAALRPLGRIGSTFAASTLLPRSAAPAQAAG